MDDSLPNTHQKQLAPSSGGRQFLTSKLTLGIRSRRSFHEKAITFDGAPDFQICLKTFISSSGHLFSAKKTSSNLEYKDFTEKPPCSPNFHFQLSSSFVRTKPSNSSKRLIRRYMCVNIYEFCVFMSHFYHFLHQ